MQTVTRSIGPRCITTPGTAVEDSLGGYPASPRSPRGNDTASPSKEAGIPFAGIPLTLVFVLALGLAACGGSGPPNQRPEATGASSSQPVLRVSDRFTAAWVRDLAGPSVTVSCAITKAPDAAGDPNLPAPTLSLIWWPDGSLRVLTPGLALEMDGDGERLPSGFELLTSPPRARQALATLAHVLPQIAPGDRDGILMRIQAADERLNRVHAYGLARMASLPPDRRLLVTCGASLGEFAKAFRLTHAQWAEGEDPRVLVDLMLSRGEETVFPVGELDPKSLGPLGEAMGLRSLDLEIAQALPSTLEQLPTPWPKNLSGLVDHTITTVVHGLGGSAPMGGLTSRSPAAGNPSSGEPGTQNGSSDGSWGIGPR